MTQITDANATVSPTALPEMCDAEALCNDLRRILVRSENALVEGDAKANIETLERWIESYRRGLSAAQKISNNGADMLQKTRALLKLALEERLRLEDEGGNTADKEHANDSEELAKAIRRIDQLLPVVETSFACQTHATLEPTH